jgi:hypothetical protein
MVTIFLCAQELHKCQILCTAPDTVATYMPGLINNISQLTSVSDFVYVTQPSHIAKVSMMTTDPTTEILHINSFITLPPEASTTWDTLHTRPTVSRDFAYDKIMNWYMVVFDDGNRKGIRSSCVLVGVPHGNISLLQLPYIFNIITHQELGIIRELFDREGVIILQFDYSVYFLAREY